MPTPYLDAVIRTDILSTSRPYQMVIAWLLTQDLPAQGHDWGVDPVTEWPWATFDRILVNDDLTGSVKEFDLDVNGDRVPNGTGGFLTHDEAVTWATLPPGSGTIG